jgi:hypothetical protein
MTMEKHSIFKAYFGRDIKGTSTVTREAFELFLIGEVDGKIDGYTITDCRGIWKGTPENVFVLEAMVQGGVGSAKLGHQLTRIAEAYNREFSQDCVLVTKSEVQAAFIG